MLHMLVGELGQIRAEVFAQHGDGLETHLVGVLEGALGYSRRTNNWEGRCLYALVRRKYMDVAG